MIEPLPWQAPLLDRLIRLRDAARLPNGLALTCAPGWGVEQLLAQAAMALLEKPMPAELAEFAHPDFRWVVPDGAVIKIDQIRRVNEFAVQTTQAAPRKVVAMLDAHLLNEQAANALLKTLEEPPPNTHLLLATTRWGRLLPTIRSRCQRFHARGDSELARAWLQAQGLTVSDAQLAELGYAPLTAYEQLNAATADLTAWLTGLPQQALADAVAPVLEVDVVAWLGRWYRRLLMHLRDRPIPDSTAPRAAVIEFADELASVRRQIESSNAANTRLLLERLVVRWLQIQRRKAS